MKQNDLDEVKMIYTGDPQPCMNVSKTEALEKSTLLLGGQDFEQFEEAIIQDYDEGDDMIGTQAAAGILTYEFNKADQAMSQLFEQRLNIKQDTEGAKSRALVKDQRLQSDFIASTAHSEVILFVDNREKRNQQDGNYLFERLTRNDFQIQLKSLPLGDFLWVLRVYHDTNNQPDNGNQTKKRGTKKKQQATETFTDYVLDFIVERKTADDLAASIMDGRYEEQKYRLKTCGINNVVYLVEGSPGQYCKIPEVVLKKAQIHTQIFHNFNVLRLATI